MPPAPEPVLTEPSPEVVYADEEETRAFLDAAFGVDLRLTGRRRRLSARSRRWTDGPVLTDDVGFSMSFVAPASAVPAWRVVRPTRGHLRTAIGNEEESGDSTTAWSVPPDTDYVGHNTELGVTVVGLDADLVQRVLGSEAAIADVLAPDNLRSTTGAGLELWDSTVQFVCREMLQRLDAETSPLLVANAQRLLVSTALELFTQDRTATPPVAPTVTSPIVRRAVAFVETHADADIGVTEMALAARVTPRALQYAFRKHLDTTPERHLRTVRLQRAHEELKAADPSAGATVAGIAARWGFFHQGRFAAAYREQFGRLPRTTLVDQ